MNFDFSDDQKALKSEARRFLEGECPVGRVRKVLDDEAKAYTLCDLSIGALVELTPLPASVL